MQLFFRSKMLLITWLVASFTNLTAQVPATYNSSDIYLMIKKLQVLGSVLYVAAHPDDENNSFLPYLAKEKLYKTGYLSLTRGDGGQNLIGSEQGVELGLIRTQELLAARRMDGCDQFFSRAYEFGFCKNAAEALRIWDKEKILSDVVWVIRQYQPDVIITRFPGDSRAGHGHHAASSLLANEAFKAAADVTKFPEQFQYGVKPWQAKRIVWNTFNFGGNNTTNDNQFKIEVGGYNPLLGKSYGEIGGEARSMHKSQGEGRPRRRGESYEYFLTTGGEAPKNDLMDGVDVSWKRIAGGENIITAINTIVANYRFEQPELSVIALVKLYTAIQQLPNNGWRNKKLAELQTIIEACSGLFAEATTAQEEVVQGGVLNVAFFVNKRSNVDIVINNIASDGFDTACAVNLANNANFTVSKSIAIAANQPITQPYWLEYPKSEGTFKVKNQLLIGKAENDAAFEIRFSVRIAGVPFVLKRPIMYKTVDPAKGELYQPLAVLPKVELRYTKDNYVSLNGQPVKAQVKFKSNIKDSIFYNIEQQYSNNWSFSRPSIVYGAANGLENEWIGNFVPVSKAQNSSEIIRLYTNHGQYNGYTKTIAYDHIPTITYFPNATANLVKLAIQTVGKKIGYIVGAGDKVPDALTQMGYEVHFIHEKDLTEDYLKQFDAIVTGIRAYNLLEYLSNKHEVLMHYVANGGNLIVQYLKSNTVGNKTVKVGPYPFIVNPIARVTEEAAKVDFLLPNHSVLQFPNKITDADFAGWVQERSTYQAEQIDAHYQTPLQMHDTFDKPSNGSLLVTPYGKGNFVYAGLVFFRQLPAGVPGAYRLMANLIALPKHP